MTDDLALSGTDQARLIRDGEVSAAELVDAHLRHIELVNPSLNAVVEVLENPARQAAANVNRKRAQGARPGPLAGVPFSIKDSIEVEGAVCTAGTLGLRSAAPSVEDAVLVARLRAADAIPIARTNLPDLLFAFESDNLIRGRTNNPYDFSRTAGSSSGGEGRTCSSSLVVSTGSWSTSAISTVWLNSPLSVLTKGAVSATETTSVAAPISSVTSLRVSLATINCTFDWTNFLKPGALTEIS